MRIGVLGVAFLVLLLCKLLGVTDLSWWWVTSPLMLMAAIPLALFGGAAVCAWLATR